MRVRALRDSLELHGSKGGTQVAVLWRTIRAAFPSVGRAIQAEIRATLYRYTYNIFPQDKKLKAYAQFPARYYSLVTSTPGSVLLQTSRFSAGNDRSYLFVRPVRTLSASSTLFDEIEQALESGAYVAGFLSYECGENLQGMNGPLPAEFDHTAGMVRSLSQGFRF